jgi:hypothetical protein
MGRRRPVADPTDGIETTDGSRSCSTTALARALRKSKKLAQFDDGEVYAAPWRSLVSGAGMAETEI